MSSAFALALAPILPRCRAHPQPRPPLRPRTHCVASLRLDGSALTGLQRRVLRSEAGRRQAIGVLAMVELPAPADDERDWAAQAASRVDALLAQQELVRVRVRGAGKRKRVAALGSALATAARAELAQSLGHTVLLYRARAEGGGLLADG